MKDLLKVVKETGQDFEWYPTTDNIIDSVKADIRKFYDDDHIKIMDIGAGDGRVLEKFPEYQKFAIEKSWPLLKELDKEIYVVGTEFEEITLIDKKIDVIFCNPPYLQYKKWTAKIIREANAEILYFIIPTRWKDSEEIKAAIESRDIKSVGEVIGTFNFLAADRKSRAVVDIVKVKLCAGSDRYRKYKTSDPFVIWFDKEFPINATNDEFLEYSENKSKKENLSNQIVNCKGRLITALVELYNRDMQKLLANYKAVCKLDSEILSHLNVNKKGLREGLKQKISGLKLLYWEEFFGRLNKLTSRLTTSTRKAMLGKLISHAAVEFTESNALAIAAWAVKNANTYYQTQLVDVVKTMVSKTNIKLYKSNQKTWKDDDWRYNRKPDDIGPFQLEYRLIVSLYDAIHVGDFGGWDTVNGLLKNAAEFIDDIITVANTVGVVCSDRCSDFEWSSGRSNKFKDNYDKVVLEVKAFKNGNLHLRFNPEFILKLNVEFGRLCGWVKNAADASKEMGISRRKAAKSLNSLVQIKLLTMVN